MNQTKFRTWLLYLGYIRSHLELVKNNFTHAHPVSDISNAAAAALTGLRGITPLQMMALK